jgi:hypothetical protein
MTTKSNAKNCEPNLEEARAFAQRHGLGELKPEYLKRLSELIAPVAHFGQQVRRARHKDDAPAPEFIVFKP